MSVRIINLSTGLTIFVDICVWFVIHMGVAAVITRASIRLFQSPRLPFKTFPWETCAFYENHLAIKSWKKWLPDAAPWFGGIPKKFPQQNVFHFIDVFITETCRGEIAHWLIILISPVFFLWNPLWVGYFMIGFGILINAPCLLVQRYNRERAIKIKSRRIVTTL